MHEFSLIRSLLRQVKEIAAKHNDGQVESHRVASVEVQIGALAGVEPELVPLAFEQLTHQTPLEHTALIIHKQALAVVCTDCEQETELEGFVFRCGHCQSGNVRIIRGDQFRLLTMTMEQEHHAC